MNKQVVLIHTSLVFFQREPLLFELFKEILPDVTITNIIEDKMLQVVMDNEFISPEITRRMCYYALSAESMGADAIFNTCSSLGPTMDVVRKIVKIPVVKIDEGMAEKVAKESRHVGVLATVATTLKPTIDLIELHATQLGKDVETKPFLSAGAFNLLMGGNTELHDLAVIQKAKEASEWADSIALAQCSMARLGPRIANEINIPVFSSPRLGVEHLKRVLYGS